MCRARPRVRAGRGIDHLVIVASDLDAAVDRYRALGFTTTPRATHPFGTGNSLVQLQGNFLELLGVTEPRRIPGPAPRHFNFAAFSRDYVERRDGMCMLVFESTDARADAAGFEAAGLDTYAPFDFQRQAALPDGSEVTVGFSLAFVTHEDMPQAAFFCCQQHAPQHFWKRDYQRHANSAVRVDEVFMVADSPHRFAPFFAALQGEDAVVREPGRLRVATARGSLVLHAPAAFEERFPGMGAADAPADPHFAGYRVGVASLARTSAALVRGEVPHHADDARRICIDAAEGFGLVIEFAVAAPA